MTKNILPLEVNNKFNIISLLLLDHKYLKECIKYLKDKNTAKKFKLQYVKHFLDTLNKHTIAEEKAVYDSLYNLEDLKREILEGQCEHNVANIQVKLLEPKLKGIRSLSDQLEMDIHVLAEIVEHHLEEEEEKMFPKIKKYLDQTILNAMGYQFMKARNFTKSDLQDYPRLQQELPIVNRLDKGAKDFTLDIRNHLKKSSKAS